MSGNRPKFVDHNYGVIAGVIQGDVNLGCPVADRAPSAHVGGDPEDAPVGVHDLLASLFDADSIRRFLSAYPDYHVIALEMPLPPASLASILFEAEHLLRRHGLLDYALRDRLMTRFPGRSRDIRRAAKAW